MSTTHDIAALINDAREAAFLSEKLADGAGVCLLRDLADALEASEAQAAALREAAGPLLNELDGEAFHSVGTAEAGTLFKHAPALRAALANPAGQQMLEEVRRLRAENAELITLHDAGALGVSQVSARLAQAEADLAAAKRDGERLDWLEKTQHDLIYEQGDPDVGVFSAWQVWRNAKWQNDRPLMVALEGGLRLAIDAAMQARQVAKGQSK